MNKKSRMASAALVVLGVSLLAASANAGMPPSRQTPVIVPSDKRGVVEVGPCQLPPCVGGVTCTPNARDYGYYESTWRQWPTQQRYDQKFPEALNSHPINQKKSAVSTTEAVPVPSPVNSDDEMIKGLREANAPSVNPQGQPKIDVDSIMIHEDSEPVPAMGNFEGPSPVPSTTIVPQPAQKVDPLLDYSTNTVPGISTAPTAVPATIPATIPATTPAPAAIPAPALSDAPDEGPELAPSPATEAAPDDMELTPPAPKEDSPLIESGDGDNSDDSLSLPLSKGEEHSIIVSQRDRAFNPYDQASDPYQAAIQVSHEERVGHEVKIAHEEKVSNEEKAIEELNPFQTAAIPSEVEYAPAVQNVPESVPAPAAPEMKPETKTVGLEGFCPVTLLETEEWVDGKEEWTVMNHGITYHLASAGQVQKFLADPDAYTPVMDGADAVVFAETGVKVPGNADNCVVFEGKLFMFANEENLNKFFANSAAYMTAIQKK
ncbi:MAG: hypothetical protein K6C40_04320 [Thermoguttaceae bacterium]|nr:hypothetical protein [Thermoguttaceae bacterium]